ncbi:hypothetical protein [Paenibacillus sp. J23TS9]|uniref:hypothetical protein n=1 Tax=Paenibacillus sp. J23TS9 TaxID=2807193 RepID=UPI001BCC245D|nr:hypothetical protein [Paenibacillus sp. J23TS9]
MKEELEQLNEWFDKSETRFNERYDRQEAMVVQATEISLDTNQILADMLENQSIRTETSIS